MEKSGGGIGVGGLLLVCFVVLKVLGKIDWSWWWVFCPVWIPLAVILTGALVVFTVSIMTVRR